MILKFKYLILFPLAAFEGPVITFIAGFLVSIGLFDLLPALIIILLGDFIPDIIFYFIGRWGSYQERVAKYMKGNTKIISNGLGTIEKLWKEHPRKTMFFAKITYKAPIPFLISAGMVKMSFLKFISYTIPVTLLQCFALFFIGYYLGESYVLTQKYVSYWVPLTILISILIVLLYIVIARLFKKEFMEFEEEIS